MGIYVTAGLNLIDVVSRVIFVLDHLRPFVEVLYCYPEYRPTAEHSFSGIQRTELLFYSRHPLITELEEVEIQKNHLAEARLESLHLGQGEGLGKYRHRPPSLTSTFKSGTHAARREPTPTGPPHMHCGTYIPHTYTHIPICAHKKQI